MILPLEKGPLRYVDYDVSRLRHLIWNGYSREARRKLRNITFMAANAIWLNAPHGKAHIERFIQLASELRMYLTLNAKALVDYGRRRRDGLRIATSERPAGRLIDPDFSTPALGPNRSACPV